MNDDVHPTPWNDHGFLVRILTLFWETQYSIAGKLSCQIDTPNSHRKVCWAGLVFSCELHFTALSEAAPVFWRVDWLASLSRTRQRSRADGDHPVWTDTTPDTVQTHILQFGHYYIYEDNNLFHELFF